MKKIMFILLSAFAITTLISCGQNEGKKALYEMERIVEKAEKEKDKLSADEWEKLTISFQENEDIANKAAETGKLGVGDKMKLVSLSARWAAAAKTSIVDEIFSRINEAMAPNETNSDSTKTTAGENSIQ